MPTFRLPFAGDLMQTINPWTWFQKTVGSQFGLINIDLGRSADPQLEAQILDDVGSYGRQLGQIGDLLGVLLKHVNLDDLTAQEQKVVKAFERQLEAIAALKEKRQAALAARAPLTSG
jgi:hypothetical protein